MKKAFQFLLAGFLLIPHLLFAKTYPVRSAVELAALAVGPGDTVVLAEGDWRDQALVFKGKGTEQLPIVLTATRPGQVRLKGRSSLRIDGHWLVVNGLYFTEGFLPKGDVIAFTEKATRCRLTNSAVVDYNPPADSVDYRWVSLWGSYNRVDHCYLKGKNHQAPTLVVWLSEQPNYHRIDHNYFGHRPPLGRNGGETIRIGTSTWSLHDSYTTVEYNRFEHCDGELEIISNKSGHNTLRHNVFFESKGTLTLRHGNFAEVYGNYFFGNNLRNTGGIRIIGENHRVHHNYLHALTGDGVSAAICLVDGIPNSPLVGYFQVKNAQVVDNTIIDCAEAFALGTGRSEQRNLPPLNCTIARNQIQNPRTLLKWDDQPIGLVVTDNRLVAKTEPTDLPAGFKKTETIKPAGPTDGEQESVGPDWDKSLHTRLHRH